MYSVFDVVSGVGGDVFDVVSPIVHGCDCWCTFLWSRPQVHSC